MFKECADIQTADMLKLPVPALVGGKPTNIQLKPSEIQKQMVAELGERADKIRNKMVKPYEDNLLKIPNDGRKLALDQRLIDPDLPDDPDSKDKICVGKIFEIWEQTMPQRSAQLVFCDLSTPKAGVFNVYDDMKAKLIERGIPETEIAFIHEANTDARKTELFGKVRSGAVRVLMGSTAKMGAGTNVQDRLIALHDLDCPWRPSDLQQRLGRIVRQGGSSGGDDALALVILKLTGWRLSRAYLFTDLTVLFASLSYIPFRRIAFSLVTVTVSSLLIDFIQGNSA